jgi:hypothetical protein
MADDYDEDDDRPRRRRVRRADDEDDDDRPRARRRDEEDEEEDEDDRPRRRRRRVPEDEDDEGDAEGATSIIVPYKNGPALAAYYCGVFGLIPIAGFVLGPIALVLGILGLVRVRNEPRAHGTGHAIAGIVLGLIDPVLWVVIVWLLWDTLMDPRKR